MGLFTYLSVRRLFLSLSHLSWPVQALLICAAFLLAGTVVVADYSVGRDISNQRSIATRNLAYIMGDADTLAGVFNESNRSSRYYGIPGLPPTPSEHERYYGTAFELPLLLLERGLEGRDPRYIYLLRHLVTHGFFLAGGFCCSLLVYRMSNRRGLALVALLLFVMQPRLYAHSFFNSKDLPFLSMFIVTLYLTHRAFRKETVGAFLLCGVSVGILTNLRIMGVMPYPVVLGLRGLDWVQARREGGRGQKHMLMTGAVFALAGPGTLYALSPYLWTNPLEFVTAWSVLARQQGPADELFQGWKGYSRNLPWHYIPTWIGISTPPVTLVLGVLGVIGVGVRSLRAPRAVLGNTDLRFGLLLAACLTLPVVVAATYGFTLYNNWRQVYFLHAPLCCLAALGLQWAGGNAPARAAVVSALVGLGVLVTGREMVRLHPHQHVYFNALVDRTTPEALRLSYVLDPWRVSCREGLDFLRRRYPATTVYVRNSWPVYRGWRTLPETDRARLRLVENDGAPDFRILCGTELQRRTNLSLENATYVRRVYNSALLTVTGLVTVPERKRSMVHRADSYQWITSGRLGSKAVFDTYTYSGGRMLGYARNGCTLPDTRPAFFVHIFPVDEEYLPAHRRRYGYDNRDFVFSEWGRWTDDKCWTTIVLPDYPIARIRTGQYVKARRIWESEVVWPAGEPEPASMRSH